MNYQLQMKIVSEFTQLSQVAREWLVNQITMHTKLIPNPLSTRTGRCLQISMRWKVVSISENGLEQVAEIGMENRNIRK